MQIVGNRHLDSFAAGDFSMACVYMKSPEMGTTESHQHDFAQYLCFFSTNSNEAKDFDTEIELSLGEEMEKHLINSPTIVYVSPGLFHGPLNFIRVNKPVMFVDIAMSARYGRVGDPKK
jgi:hypothetical protein